jgi:hypothetical protein
VTMRARRKPSAGRSSRRRGAASTRFVTGPLQPGG